MKKAIFLDRDGTINVDSHYVFRTEDLVLLDGVKEGIGLLKNLWYLLILVTNQSGIGRGYYTLDDAHRFNEALEWEIGHTFDAIHLCPHLESDQCECRKPKISNIRDAQERFDLCLEQSYFIGDRKSDILCGASAGCMTVLINTPEYARENDIEADHIVPNIWEFATRLA